MPIINFQPSEILASMLMDNGSYTGEFIDIKAPVKSKSGNSTNIWSDFTVTSGKYTGKMFTLCFCDGMSSASLLGQNMFFPKSYLSHVIYAITGEKLDPQQSSNVDSDTLLNKSVDFKIAQVVNSDGQMGNMITDFLPAGSANKAPAF